MKELSRSDPTLFWWIQIHKSNRLSILVLSVVRVLWRVATPMPALISGMAPWERFAARFIH
jgi:cytochrome b561